MKSEEKPIVIAVVGPTAVGKTKIAIQLAQEFNAEIISADSRQFYRELSIGTAKPSPSELKEATHHFINNLSINRDYNASAFEKDALAFLTQYFEHQNIAILCGGSGMYVDALLKGFDSEVPTADKLIRKELNERLDKEGIESIQALLKQLDPELYKTIDLQNAKRLLRAIEVCLIIGKPFSEIRKNKHKKRDFNTIKIGLNEERELLYTKINLRVDQMLQNGLLEEVKSVQQFKHKNALKTVGYKELFAHLDGMLSFDEAVEKIKVNSRRYAKRQLTWFKNDKEIEWFAPDQKAQIIEYIRSRIFSNGQ
ncbi:MAG: tRNA (adenosine(37)-N6)-dimethylallyltransferase MiaA [Vicingaceae bacterium]